jgi:hypothetical protein
MFQRLKKLTSQRTSTAQRVTKDSNQAPTGNRTYMVVSIPCEQKRSTYAASVNAKHTHLLIKLIPNNIIYPTPKHSQMGAAVQPSPSKAPKQPSKTKHYQGC